MKVFVVTTTFKYETFQQLEGVFSSKEKAQEFIDKCNITSDDTEIIEEEIDLPAGYEIVTTQTIVKKPR